MAAIKPFPIMRLSVELQLEVNDRSIPGRSQMLQTYSSAPGFVLDELPFCQLYICLANDSFRRFHVAFRERKSDMTVVR
jgi:hypothetical protein